MVRTERPSLYGSCWLRPSLPVCLYALLPHFNLSVIFSEQPGWEIRVDFSGRRDYLGNVCRCDMEKLRACCNLL